MTTGIYVIDLSDNLNPMIFGELEFPDYSSYLHPISDSLLLGIGQNVNPNRFPTLASNENDMSPVIYPSPFKMQVLIRLKNIFTALLNLK